MKTRLIIILLKFLSTLPFGMVRFIGGCTGRLLWILNSRMKVTTMQNLRRCFPTMSLAEQEVLGKASLVNTMQTLMEAGPVWLWPTQSALDLIARVEGLELLERAVEQGKGVIVLAPHLGNWEILGLYLNTCGQGQSYQLYQAPDNAALNELVLKGRSRAGAKLVATDNKGVADLLRALRAGEIAGILPDQVPPRSGGEYANFFGSPALTMTLLSKLQSKTGARVVTAYAKREVLPKAGFSIIFREPDARVYASDMQEALLGLNSSVERLVQEEPAQYQWEYKRFKRQPIGTQDPYR